MKLSKQEIKNLAELARLELSPSEVSLYSRQLSSIVDFIETLNKVKEPLAYKLTSKQKNVYRLDRAEPWDEAERETALNQGSRQSGFIVSPPVL